MISLIAPLFPLVFAAGADAPPAGAADMGICAPLLQVVDPDGDGVFDNTGSAQARTTAEGCRAAGDRLGAVSVAYTLRGADQPDAARAALAGQPITAESERMLCLLDGDSKLPSAIAHCDKAIALRPNWAIAYSTRAQMLVALGRAQEALPSSEEAVRLAPRYPGALLAQARVLEAVGRKEDALSAFTRAAAAAPRAHTYLNEMARLQIALGRNAQAAASLDRSIALRPTAFAHNERGKLRRNARQFEAAADDFEAAVTLQPDWAEPWVESSYAMQDQRQYVAAIALLDEAIALAPDWAEPTFSRGFCFEKLGDKARAEADYLRAVDQGPKWTPPLLALASLASGSGDYAKALEWAKRAIDAAPNESKGYNAAGYASFNLKHFIVARDYYDNALKIDPKSQPSLFWRARTFTALGLAPEAIADYTRLLEINPGYGWAWVNRGTLRASQLDMSDAVADFDRAAPILKDQSGFWDMWLIARYKYTAMGDGGAATTPTQRAQRQQAMFDVIKANWPVRDVAGAYHARGTATLYATGEPALAIQDLRRAAALDGDSKLYSSTVETAVNHAAWLKECRTVPEIKQTDTIARVSRAQMKCYPTDYAFLRLKDESQGDTDYLSD